MRLYYSIFNLYKVGATQSSCSNVGRILLGWSGGKVLLWGGGLPAVWRSGGDSVAFCHRVRGPGGGEGAVWTNRWGSVGGNLVRLRENRGEGGEKHPVVGGDVEKEKKINVPTNAGTCTSVVRAHRGADRKALPPKNIVSYHLNFLLWFDMQEMTPLITFGHLSFGGDRPAVMLSY